jgi:hypothetical protein
MTKKGNNWIPAFAGMTVRGTFGDDKKICHSGMGLAGIQKSFNKLDAGLRRYDGQGGHSGMTKKYVIPAWA